MATQSNVTDPALTVESAQLHGVTFEAPTAHLNENQMAAFLERYARPTADGGKETHFLACLRLASNLAMVDCLYHPDVYDPEKGQEKHPSVKRDDIPLDHGATIARQYNWLNRQGKMRVPFEQVLEVARETWKERTQHYLPFLTEQHLTLNSPTWTGLGTGLGQTAACFVLPLSDDLVRNSDSITQTMQNAIAIQQTGGGNGFQFGTLRPKNSHIKRSGGRSSGPITFMGMYDSSFGAIEQGGSRRGANMAVMFVSHPDIEEFIACKNEEGVITNFNISVALTDEFMGAVRDDRDFSLRWPEDGPPVKTVKARELMRKIAENAHRNGEPGVLFIDQANRENPVPHLYRLTATNPCGEQWLGPYENCCLGHINLAHCVTGDRKIDWNKLREITATLTMMLDNNVDANNYVDAVPQLEVAAMNVRRIGVSFMGMWDLMADAGVRYGSREGQELAGQISEFIRFHTMQVSIERARDRGPFEKIEGSIYQPGNVTWEVPRSRYEHDFGRPKLDWTKLATDLRRWGIRNGAQMTVAPTGTTGTIAGVDGYGCEPAIGLSHIRRMKTREGEKILFYGNRRFERSLREQGLSDEEIQSVLEKVYQNPNGSCQGVPDVPESVRYAFVVAGDITPEGHVRMQAAMQHWIDNSISKTINLPHEATIEDVEKAYFLLHELGCKGGTVYRQGSRDDEVLTNTGRLGTTQRKLKITVNGKKVAGYIAAPTVKELFKERKTNERGELVPISLPTQVDDIGIPAIRYRTPTAIGEAGDDAKMAVVLSLAGAILVFPEGEEIAPLELFANVGKSGQDTQVMAEAVGRQNSTLFRMGAAIEVVIDQLNDIGGRYSVGFGERKVRSMPDAIAKVLKRFAGVIGRNGNGHSIPQTVVETKVSDHTGPISLGICPKCQNRTLAFQEGCFMCLTGEGGCGQYQGCS